MKRRLYIDFDGVVMDTIPFLYSALEKSEVDLSNEREVSIFFATYDFNKIINDENILNDSIECINKLVASDLFEISFLTHVNSLTEGCVKVEYLRNKFKAISRGKILDTSKTFDENSLLVLDKTYQDEAISIVMNFSASEYYQYDFSNTSYNEVEGQLVSDINTYIGKIDDKVIVLPPYSIAIIK